MNFIETVCAVVLFTILAVLVLLWSIMHGGSAEASTEVKQIDEKCALYTVKQGDIVQHRQLVCK